MNKYSFQGYQEENMARAIAKDIGVSTKNSIEVCSFIRRKKVTRAKRMLEDVIKQKIAVPYKRAYKDIAHKPGMAAGKYPEKICKEILRLLNSVESNAQAKGLNTQELEIIHINAHLAARPMHSGRQRRRSFKKTHIEIVVKEKEVESKTKKETKVEEKVKEPVKEEKKQVEEVKVEEKKKPVEKEIKKEEVKKVEKKKKVVKKSEDNKK